MKTSTKADRGVAESNNMRAEALSMIKEAQTEFNNLIKAIAKSGGLEKEGVLRGINDTKQKLYGLQDILSIGEV